MHLGEKMSHRVILSSIILRFFCDDGSGLALAFRSMVILVVISTSPALGRIMGGIDFFRSFVPHRMVGTSDLSLPDTAGGEVPRESLVWPRSTFCATRAGHWDGDVVSVISDRVRQDNSTQNV